MRILFIASGTHLMGTGGGVTHTRGILNILESIDEAALTCLSIPLPMKHWPRKVRQLRALGGGLFSERPSKSLYLLGTDAEKRVKSALEKVKPDVVFFNVADLLPLSHLVDADTPCVLVTQNVETKIIEDQMSGLRVPSFVRQIFERDVEKTRLMEEDGARRMNAVIAVSRNDARWYLDISPNLNIIIISGIFEYEHYQGPRPALVRPLQVAYLAKMSWYPNFRGAKWFVDLVLPELPAGMIDTHFFGPGSETFDGLSPALHGHGFVDRLETVWRASNFTICPILEGSGINIKLIESLYNRIPVLATPHAIRGLPELDDPAVAVVPPDEWPEFLRSESAMSLAASTVREETARLFSARSSAIPLGNLLQNLAGPSYAATER